MKKMVIKVNITNEKQQQSVFQAISDLKGINNMAVDREKGTLTVTGTVDPVCVIKKLRKSKKQAQIDSIAAEKKEPAVDDKTKKPDLWPPPSPYPYYYAPCSPYICQAAVVEETTSSCVIL